MNDHTQQPDDAYRPEGQSPEEIPMHRRDELISRVVDGCANGADWDRFRAIAADDQEIWSELAIAQRQYEGLCETMNSVSAVADSVELPGGMIQHTQHQHRFEMVSRWGGWAAAAAILLVWATSVGTGGLGMNAANQQAGMIPIGGNTMLQAATPDEAMNQYLSAGHQAGRVVGEIPNPIVVETRAMPDGTFEVLYIRQILERKILDEVFRETNDEFGNAITVPITKLPNQIKTY
ncbi:MAG: hypothetical protein JKY96_08140 [Phycisphaerales bacterium]|nr:hypothetical protein [Phycisphaerales bacterium]